MTGDADVSGDADVTGTSRQRYVVHLTVLAADLAGATQLARTLGRSVSFLPEIDPGETTVSEEDNQGVHHRVFCDRLLGNGRRCMMRAAHVGACLPKAAR